MPLFLLRLLLKIRHPERSECEAFAPSKDRPFRHPELVEGSIQPAFVAPVSGGPDYFVVRAREARRKRIISL